MSCLQVAMYLSLFAAPPEVEIQVRDLDLDPAVTSSVTVVVADVVRELGFEPVLSTCSDCSDLIEVNLIGGVARFDMEVKRGRSTVTGAVPIGPKTVFEQKIANLIRAVLAPRVTLPGRAIGDPLRASVEESDDTRSDWIVDGALTVTVVASVAAAIAGVVAITSTRDLERDTYFNDALDSSVSTVETSTGISIVSLSVAGVSLASALLLSE